VIESGASSSTERGERDGAVLLGGVAVGFVLLEVLRVWMPSLVVILGEARSTGPLGLALAALGTLAVAPIIATLFGPLPPRLIWLLGGAVLLGSRLALQLVDGGAAQLLASTVGVAGGVSAVAALAAGSARGDIARLGVIGGAAVSTAVLTVLASVDLAWRPGTFGALGTLTVVAVTAPPLLRATRALDGGRAAAAWPWGTLGPALVLLGVLVGPAGRIAVATGWTPGRVAATNVAILALVALGGLVAARYGPLLAGTAGAVLVLTGTAAALDADGVRAVVGQAALATGLGLVVVSGVRGGGTSPRRRGVVAGASLTLFGAFAFAAYAGSLVTLPFGVHAVMLTAAALLAGATLLSTLRAARLGREPASPLLVAATATTLVVSFALSGVGALRSPAEPAPPSDTGSLRLVLANVHYGFDVEGRQRALDVGELLAELGADLIALNEVDRGWMISGSPDLLSTYTLATGLQPVFAGASDEVWGNALLTRFPVLEVQRMRLPRGRDPLARSALTVVVELPDGSPLAVVVTHLSNVDRQGDTRLPQAQAVAAIVARLRERGIPTVVAGDLNARPGDPELAVLEDLELTRALPESRPTFPDASATVQIDHVLVPDGLIVTQADTLATGMSDHRFVIVTLHDGRDAG
jgi:endonuclease/exonuclease/phosphatase family metal-dependent hydrolase